MIQEWARKSRTSGWSGSKAVSGEETTGALTADTKFTLVCTGSGGTAQDNVTVAVSAPPPVNAAAADSGGGRFDWATVLFLTLCVLRAGARRVAGQRVTSRT